MENNSRCTVEVSETPNWLKELEAKREKRVKAKLGHEHGAGAPCLECKDQCPGLDLHFWRKICKNCKCAKENHEIPDDDIYGHIQFELLGRKINKNKTKIVLPGKKDEVELEWAPQGQKDIVDKYLKQLPSELLPIKGSQAALERKQLLQKQLPVHDIDPTLCHELTPEELKKMQEYILHIKENSVGIGNLVQITYHRGANHTLDQNGAIRDAFRPHFGASTLEGVILQPEEYTKNISKITHGLNDLNMPQFNKNNPYDVSENIQNPYIPTLHDIQHATHPLGVKNNPHSNILSPNNNSSPISQNQQHPSVLGLKNIPYDAYTQTQGHNNFQGHNDPIFQGQTPNQVFSPNNNTRNDETLLPKHLGVQNVEYNPEMTPDLIGGHGPLKNYQNMSLNVYENLQNPSRISNIKDLAFSTYNPDYLGGNMGSQMSPNSLNVAETNLHPQNIGIRNLTPGLNTFTPDNMTLQNVTPENLKQQYDETNRMPQGMRFRDMTPELRSQQVGNKTLQNMTPENQKQQYGDANLMPQDMRFRNVNPELLSQQTGYNRAQNMTLQNNTPGNMSSGNITSENMTPGNLGNENVTLEQKITTTGGHLLENVTLGNMTPENIPVDNHGKHQALGNTTENTNQRNTAPGKVTLDNMTPGNIPVGNYANQPSENSTVGINQGNTTSGNMTPNMTPGKMTLGKMTPENLKNMHTRPNLANYSPNFANLHESKYDPTNIPIGVIKDIEYLQENDLFDDLQYPNYVKNLHKFKGDLFVENENVVLPKCFRCEEFFKEDDIAVGVDSRGDYLYHPNCFKCFGCNQILADMMYFYDKESGNIYCCRDYAKIRGIPRCKACDELIFPKEYCLADNNTFHIKHFCCFICDSALAGQNYLILEENQQPVCIPCYNSTKANKCFGCHNIILPNEEGLKLKDEVHFHVSDSCFACKICFKPLLGAKLLFRNDKLYCSHDCFNSDK